MNLLLRKNINAITLIELLIGITIVSIMVLSLYSIDSFSRGQLMNSDRRAKVQNELSYVIEHMTKYTQKASGTVSNKAIEAIASGFQLRVDLRDPGLQTPSDLNDAWVSYVLTGNTLSASCIEIIPGNGACGSFVNENLSAKIVAGFVSGTLPDPLPNNPAGFYVLIGVGAQSNLVDIGLVGRYNPTEVPTPATKSANPQVAMKTKIICNSASTN